MDTSTTHIITDVNRQTNLHEAVLSLSEQINLMNSMNKKILNFEEARLYLDVSKDQLYRLTSGKRIPHYKPNGKLLYFNREELDQWIMSGKVEVRTTAYEKAINYVNSKKSKV